MAKISLTKHSTLLMYGMILLQVLLICPVSKAQDANLTDSIKRHELKMQWWKDAKFGMFIHWGIYSVPAGKWGDNTSYGEWIMYNAKIPRTEYATLAKKFNPTKFDANEWVKLAKDAGQKYIVITSKHHDGFAMFGSKVDGYNIVEATPFKRDILKELADACRQQGMKLGFYYSQAQDWYHPGGAVSRNAEWDSSHLADMGKYIDEIALPQVKEILSNYGDVAVLWWDTPTNMTREMTLKLTAVAQQYPNLITNNRLGAGMGGDLETPEQFIPFTGFPGRNWEVCMTMNGHWGYNAYDERWKSTNDLLRKLIDIVSKGGNFLLNVGPDSYGIIPEVCQQNLREMGDWLKLNGEAIYGTKASPFPYLPWGRATMKGQQLFLHVFDWPKDGKLVLPLKNKISTAYLLADPKSKLILSKGKDNTILQVPAYAPDRIASVLVVNYEGPLEVAPPATAGARVISSSSETSNPATCMLDGDPKSVWHAVKGTKNATVEITLAKALPVHCISLMEPWQHWNGIVQKVNFQYFDGKEWRNVLPEFNTPGAGIALSFEPVLSSKFRLNIQNEKEAPALNELVLFHAY